MLLIIRRKIIELLNSKSLKNGALFSLFSFVNRGFSFILLMVLANYITPEEYGYLSLFNTVIMVMTYFVCLSSDGYLSVAYFNEGENGFKNTVTEILYTALIFAIVILAVLFLFGERLSILLGLPRDVLNYATIIVFFTLFVNMNLDYHRIQEKVRSYGFLSCGNAALNFALSIIFVKVFLHGWQGRVYAQLSCSILFGAYGLITFIKGGYFGKPNFPHWRKTLLWGIPLIPHLATAFLRQGCDTYIINYYHTVSDVGLFNFALTLSGIILMVGTGFNQSNSVDIYKTLSDKALSDKDKIELLKNRRSLYWKIYGVATIVVAIMGYFIVPIFLPKYSAAMKYFLLLSVYAFLFCGYYIYTNYLFFYKKTKLIMSVTLCSACLHLLLSLMLTKFSLYLTCAIYIFTQLLVLILIKHFAVRELNSQLLIGPNLSKD